MARYPGGKNSDGVFQILVNQIPPHRVRIEAFMGSGPLLRLMRPAEINIGIDLNGEAISAFCKNQPGRLVLSGDASGGIAVSGERIRDLHTASGDGSSSSHHGNRGSSSPTGTGDVSSHLIQADAIEFLRAYKFTGGEFIYCDPPYLIESRSHKGRIYQSEFTDWQHLQLLKLLKRLRCLVMISGYWSRLYEEMLEGWRVITYPSYTRGHQRATEYLWMNYPAPAQLHDYSYLGKNFRQREKVKLRHKSLLGKFRRLAPLEQQMFLAAALAQSGDERSRKSGSAISESGERRRQLTQPADVDTDASKHTSKM